jgi:hypothetical protein
MANRAEQVVPGGQGLVMHPTRWPDFIVWPLVAASVGWFALGLSKGLREVLPVLVFSAVVWAVVSAGLEVWCRRSIVELHEDVVAIRHLVRSWTFKRSEVSSIVVSPRRAGFPTTSFLTTAPGVFPERARLPLITSDQATILAEALGVPILGAGR